MPYRSVVSLGESLRSIGVEGKNQVKLKVVIFLFRWWIVWWNQVFLKLKCTDSVFFKRRNRDIFLYSRYPYELTDDIQFEKYCEPVQAAYRQEIQWSCSRRWKEKTALPACRKPGRLHWRKGKIQTSKKFLFSFEMFTGKELNFCFTIVERVCFSYIFKRINFFLMIMRFSINVCMWYSTRNTHV